MCPTLRPTRIALQKRHTTLSLTVVCGSGSGGGGDDGDHTINSQFFHRKISLSSNLCNCECASERVRCTEFGVFIYLSVISSQRSRTKLRDAEQRNATLCVRQPFFVRSLSNFLRENSIIFLSNNITAYKIRCENVKYTIIHSRIETELK